MAILPSLAAWMDAGSGLVALGLGAWWLLRQRHRPTDGAFGAACVTLGLHYFLGNLVSQDDPLRPVLSAGPVWWVTRGAAALAVGWLAWLAPRPLSRNEHPAALLVGLLIAGQLVALLVFEAPETPVLFLEAVLFNLLFGAFAFGMLLAPLRAATDRNGPRFEASLLLGAGFLVFPGLADGLGVGLLPQLDPGARLAQNVGAALVLGLYVVCAALWLRTTSVTPGPRAGYPRNLALLTLAIPLVALAAQPTLGYEAAVDSGVLGPSRVVTLALLAYGLRTSDPALP